MLILPNKIIEINSYYTRMYKFSIILKFPHFLKLMTQPLFYQHKNEAFFNYIRNIPILMGISILINIY